MDKFINDEKESDSLLDIDWDFKSADTKEFTHGIHLYPARMVPQIARALINRFSEPESIILDPFCGSGTVLLESAISGHQSIGVDINPLAVLISRTKSNPINPNSLEKELSQLKSNIIQKLQNYECGKETVVKPEFKQTKQIDYWFTEAAQIHLSILRDAVSMITNPEIKQFFQSIFSDAARKVSNTRNNEYKLYRLSPDDLRDYNPNGIETFLELSKKAIRGMKTLFKKIDLQTYPIPKVYQSSFADIELDNSSVDLMVTSPPYGDSHTTVGYGQFSKYSLLWLGNEFSEYIPNSRDMLGGKKLLEADISSQTLDETLLLIKKKELDLKNKREYDVKSFFADYQVCIKKIFDLLKDGCYACFVIGNRAVREVRIRMDLITREIGEPFGFKHYLTIPRNIPIKRLPFAQKLYVDPKWKGIKDKRKATEIQNIVKESIVILKKS